MILTSCQPVTRSVVELSSAWWLLVLTELFGGLVTALLGEVGGGDLGGEVEESGSSAGASVDAVFGEADAVTWASCRAFARLTARCSVRRSPFVV